jgi:hypothetical protein
MHLLRCDSVPVATKKKEPAAAADSFAYDSSMI